MKKISLALVSGLCFFLFFSVGCKSYDEKENELTDTPSWGSINVSADESFKPIVDELVKVYESNNPGTTIRVTYKPEAECLKDLVVDSVRMVIATRGFNKAEEEYIVDSMQISPRSMVVARDAVAVIINPLANDSLLSMPELKEILTGKFKTNLIPVFDGVQATSTVRFIVDSVLKNDSLTPRSRAARTSEGVIDYIARDPQAIGIIGVSWIGNKEDSTQVSFLKKVKIVQLESTDAPGRYVLPVQYNIYFKRYPMVRDLVYILKERHRGLGTGFADFIGGLQGQLIFKRAYLMPVQNNFIVRPARLRD